MLKFGLIEPGLQFSAKHLQQHWGAVILARHLNIAKLILFIFINTEHTNKVIFQCNQSYKYCNQETNNIHLT